MDTEQLVEYANDIKNNLSEIIDVLQDKEDLKERVQELESLCKQLVGEEWMNDEGLYESEMMKLENKYLALRNIHNITLKTGELVAEENKRYKQAMQNAINACRYTNPEVAYILSEALEGEE